MITHGNEIKLFSGNSNLPLAQAIAKKLNTELGGIEVTTFSDGEISVHIEETVRGQRFVHYSVYLLARER